MFLDRELREIQAAKARLSTRCDLQRQMVRLEAHAAWAGVRRRLSTAVIGLSLGLHVSEFVLNYLSKRKG